MTSTAEQSLADRFALIMDALRQAVAARGASKRGHGCLQTGPVLILLWTRLGRMAARFAALAAWVGAGGRPPFASPHTRTRSIPSALAAIPRLPRGFGWLVREAPEAACHGSQLRHLLSDAEFATLVAAAPALGRVLRPLCRMLAIEPPPCVATPRRDADAARRAARAAAPPGEPRPGEPRARSPSAGAARSARRLPPGLLPISGT